MKNAPAEIYVEPCSPKVYIVRFELEFCAWQAQVLSCDASKPAEACFERVPLDYRRMLIFPNLRL